MTLSRVAEERINAYVDAVLGVRALEQAERDEGKTEERSRALRQAKADLGDAIKVLNGGQLGEARRRLAARPAEEAAG